MAQDSQLADLGAIVENYQQADGSVIVARSAPALSRRGRDPQLANLAVRLGS